MRKIVLMNGSPNGKNSVSHQLLEQLARALGNSACACSFVHMRARYQTEVQMQKDIDDIADANAVVFSSPLYIYCLPGMTIEFLEKYHERTKGVRLINPPLAYAIVNCGLPDPLHNRDALRVLRHFSRRLGFQWRFGIGIGAGAIVGATKNTFLGRLLNQRIAAQMKRVVRDLENPTPGPQEDAFVKPKVTDWMFLRLGNASWLPKAKKNGLEPKDLYCRPYS